MAYAGSTAGSSVANPPSLMPGPFWGKRSTTVWGSTSLTGHNLWRYNTTDSSTEMTSATYFSDAYYIGLKEGDIIFGCIDTGSSKGIYMGVVGAVTTAGGALASSGGMLSSTR